MSNKISLIDKIGCALFAVSLTVIGFMGVALMVSMPFIAWHFIGKYW